MFGRWTSESFQFSGRRCCRVRHLILLNFSPLTTGFWFWWWFFSMSFTCTADSTTLHSILVNDMICNIWNMIQSSFDLFWCKLWVKSVNIFDHSYRSIDYNIDVEVPLWKNNCHFLDLLFFYFRQIVIKYLLTL